MDNFWLYSITLVLFMVKILQEEIHEVLAMGNYVILLKEDNLKDFIFLVDGTVMNAALTTSYLANRR